MRAIICAGVTAGHINPAIAVANEIMINEPKSEIVFAIFPEGMEERLIKQAGYRYVMMHTRPFVRSFSPRGLYWNGKTAVCLLKTTMQTRKLIKSFKPDVMLGFGGFTSGPVIREGAILGIPTAIHEANAFPGMANKLLSKRVNLIMLGMEAAKDRFSAPSKCVFTGNPVRQSVLTADRAAARAKRGISNNDKCILSMGGSNGARQLNEAVAEYIAENGGKKHYFHFHSTGEDGYEDFMAALDSRGFDPSEHKNIVVSKYINDVPECLAAADLVIARSGAMTIAEISASGTASILIPSPNVTENHQFYNAMALSDAGAARVIEEKDLTPQLLTTTIDSLSSNDLKLMGINARTCAIPNAGKMIYSKIKEMQKGLKK